MRLCNVDERVWANFDNELIRQKLHCSRMGGGNERWRKVQLTAVDNDALSDVLMEIMMVR